jgi:hypothetical protein
MFQVSFKKRPLYIKVEKKLISTVKLMNFKITYITKCFLLALLQRGIVKSVL